MKILKNTDIKSDLKYIKVKKKNRKHIFKFVDYQITLYI